MFMTITNVNLCFPDIHVSSADRTPGKFHLLEEFSAVSSARANHYDSISIFF